MESSQLVATIITVLIILVVLFLIWYLYRRTNASTPTIHEEAKTPMPAAVPAAMPAAAAVRAVSPALPDDLTVLEGIGPKVNSLLQAAGITTFAKLSETDPAVISEILQANRLQMLDPRSWPKQAGLAAAGDEAGLKALQEKLKGGRAA